MGKSSRSKSRSSSCNSAMIYQFFLVAIPLAAMVILGCAGLWTLPVFTLNQSGAVYKISSRRYTVNGSPALEKDRYAYPAPDSWPEPIQDVSLWLLFHMILAILINVYLVVLFGSMALRQYRHDRSVAITRPVWWTLIPAVLLAISTIGLGVRDAVFWGQGGQGFKPANPLGYFAVIVCILLGLLWLLVLLLARRLPVGHRDDTRRGYTSSSDRRDGRVTYR